MCQNLEDLADSVNWKLESCEMKRESERRTLASRDIRNWQGETRILRLAKDWDSGPFGLVYIWVPGQISMTDCSLQRTFPCVSQAMRSKKAMIIYLKPPTTALNMGSCCFPAWISSVAPWSLLNNRFPGVAQGLLFVCSVTSASTAPLHVIFHRFISVTQILFTLSCVL